MIVQKDKTFEKMRQEKDAQIERMRQEHRDEVNRWLQLGAQQQPRWSQQHLTPSPPPAMSAAVENAAVMCYGVSQAYKESANCRLEAQYAYQQKKDMIPLMMEDGYRPNGWLGMLLGVRLWYGLYGMVLESDQAFEGKIEELSRELGERAVNSSLASVIE